MKKRRIWTMVLLMAALLMVELLFCGLALADPEDPQLLLDITASKSLVDVGNSLTFTVTLTNTGTVTAGNTAVKVELLQGLDDVQVGKSDSTELAGDTWMVTRLEQGESKQLQLTGTVQSGPVLRARAWVSGEPIVEAKADAVPLPIEMTADKLSAVPGDALTYIVTVTNTSDDSLESIYKKSTCHGTGCGSFINFHFQGIFTGKGRYPGRPAQNRTASGRSFFMRYHARGMRCISLWRCSKRNVDREQVLRFPATCTTGQTVFGSPLVRLICRGAIATC